jgi:hypothetical protein
LRQHGVQISERQVDYLYARYRAVLGCADRLEVERLKDVVKERGGLIIGLNGLERKGASEQLWMVREAQAERFLMVDWLSQVNRETLSVLLKPIADLALPVLATVSNGQGCVMGTLRELWPGVSHHRGLSPFLGRATGPTKRLAAATGRRLD